MEEECLGQYCSTTSSLTAYSIIVIIITFTLMGASSPSFQRFKVLQGQNLANGSYLMCLGLHYYLHLLYRIRSKLFNLFFCNYMNENFEIVGLQLCFCFPVDQFSWVKSEKLFSFYNYCWKLYFRTVILNIKFQSIDNFIFKSETENTLKEKG